MRSVFTSRWGKASIAAVIAGVGLVATTTGAEARYCGYWRNGYCAEWRYNTYDPGPAAALNAFGNFVGAAIASSQPRYYYPPPPPAYTYYSPPYRYYPPPPAYRYYPAPPAYGYYGPEPRYGLVIR
jgi:hypothetical protein